MRKNKILVMLIVTMLAISTLSMMVGACVPCSDEWHINDVRQNLVLYHPEVAQFNNNLWNIWVTPGGHDSHFGSSLHVHLYAQYFAPEGGSFTWFGRSLDYNKGLQTISFYYTAPPEPEPEPEPRPRRPGLIIQDMGWMDGGLMTMIRNTISASLYDAPHNESYSLTITVVNSLGETTYNRTRTMKPTYMWVSVRFGPQRFSPGNNTVTFAVEDMTPDIQTIVR